MKFRKTIISLSMAVAVVVGSNTIAFAAVCNNAPDKVHHFNSKQDLNYGYESDGGTHTYIYGYDANKVPITKSDCHISNVYEYYQTCCSYCGQTTGSAYAVYQYSNHSVKH